MTDARQARRIPLDVEVHVFHDGRDEMLLSHDWSRDGVFLRTRKPLPVGAQVEVALRLPSHPQPVRMPATVTRTVESNQSGEGRPPGMGLHLRGVPEDVRRYLQELSAAAPMRHAPLAAQAMPTLLLMGASGHQRLHLALALDGMGYDVVETTDPNAAEQLLAHGLHPQVVVAIETPEAPQIFELSRRLAATPFDSQPSAAVVLADTMAFGGDVEWSVAYPTVFLPLISDEKLIGQVLAMFAPVKSAATLERG